MTQADLAAWLDAARDLFAQVHGTADLRIIVADARNHRRAVEYRIPAPVLERVVTITPDVEAHVRLAAGAHPSDPSGTLGLSDDERAVLRACLTRPLAGKTLCRELGWPYNGTSRTVFAGLRRRGLLINGADGYGLTAAGRAACASDNG